MRQPQLTPGFLKRLFIAASIRRWNDQACPVEFSELDKQAHKAMVAILLAKHAPDPINYSRLITYFCFEFLSRVVLTDIKPPIYYKLLETHRQALADYVQEEVQEEVKGYVLFKDLHTYLCHPPEDLESALLRAAHHYVSAWEFSLIYDFNPRMYGVQEIKDSLDNALLKDGEHLSQVPHLKLLASMFAQLRFQKRWSQTPRVPPTSVLGHALYVALCAFLLSFDLGACESMRVNHFLGGLFHDLPEILTRDIISPIKHGVKGLDTYLKEIEAQEMENKLLRYVSAEFREDLLYFTQDEFSNRYLDPQTKQVHHVDLDTLWQTYNRNLYQGVCGTLLKVCDQLSAFIEATMSIAHGVRSDVLVRGAAKIQQKYARKSLCEVDVGVLFRDFTCDGPCS
ncbi:HD domain-containing protein [Helicobacter salomonis]|uniref:HD domain-containing protein n=1 Tax=Helicobacter salomonis TaxID=56878 RepID=UPI000CF0E8C3|nr:HD domain-containing protein [Helicobacter salomonis]